MLDHRAPFSARYRNFVEFPASSDVNSTNDLILNSVIAWSFYPKLLTRDGRGWRNVSNNQSVSLHPASVNKGSAEPTRWLSFYEIMQSSSKYASCGYFMFHGTSNLLCRFYNARETSPIEDFAVALVCGEADFKVGSSCAEPLVSRKLMLNSYILECLSLMAIAFVSHCQTGKVCLSSKPCGPAFEKSLHRLYDRLPKH